MVSDVVPAPVSLKKNACRSPTVARCSVFSRWITAMAKKANISWSLGFSQCRFEIGPTAQNHNAVIRANLETLWRNLNGLAFKYAIERTQVYGVRGQYVLVFPFSSSSTGSKTSSDVNHGDNVPIHTFQMTFWIHNNSIIHIWRPQTIEVSKKKKESCKNQQPNGISVSTQTDLSKLPRCNTRWIHLSKGSLYVIEQY